MKLSKAEEQVIHHLWKLDKAFMKDLILEYGDPKPATTTIATLLKRMKNKGFIDYEVVGASRQYFALIDKSDYFKGQFSGMLQKFFGNSAAKFASFFTKSTDLSQKELEDLREIIDMEIEKKKK